MKKGFTPFMFVGLAIIAVYIVVDRFITTIDAVLAIPILLFAIGMIVIDGVKRRGKN